MLASSQPHAPISSPTHLPGKASIRHLPVNLFGSVMGLSGLALAWRQAGVQFGVPHAIGEGIGAFAIAVLVLLLGGYGFKALRYPDAVAAEFAHPIAGNFFGTVAISLLLVSALILPYSQPLAELLWTVGAVAAFVLAFVVASRLLRGGGAPENAVPAWLIPGVATLDIAVTGAHMPMAWAGEVNWGAMAVGSVLALVLFTLIFQRLVRLHPLSTAMVPSLMVLVAPFAVGFLAYTNLAGGVDRFAAVLFYFALFIFLVLAPKVFRSDVPFSPTWWAISFPIAALSNAALRYSAVHPTTPLETVAITVLLFLTVALAILAMRTLHIAFNGKLLAG